MVFIPPYDPQQHRSVHDEAANRLHSWYNNHVQQEQEVTKSAAVPDIMKVGPHGYIHGWIKVGSAEHDDLQHGVKFSDTRSKISSSLDKAYEASKNGDHTLAYNHLDKAHDAVAIGGKPNGPLASKIIALKASEKKKIAKMTDANKKELARQAAVHALDAQIDRDKDTQLRHFVNTGEVLPPKKYQYPPAY